jgi:hypothetical protein
MLPMAMLSFGILPTAVDYTTVSPRPIVSGGTKGNLLFGKLQRATQLPGTRLSTNPLAAVDELGQLEKLLWSSFSMANVPQGDSLSRREVGLTRSIENAMLFVDCMTPEKPKGLFSGLPFGGKSAAAPPPSPPIDTALLDLAASRNALHAFVLLEDTAALRACVSALEGSALRATLFAPEDGVSVRSTAGWVSSSLQECVAHPSNADPLPPCRAADADVPRALLPCR